MGLAVDNCDDTDMKPFNLSSVIVAYTHSGP